MGKYLDRQRQIADRHEAEIIHGLLDVGDASGQSEKGGIHQLQHFCGDHRIGGDDPCHFAGGHGVSAQGAAQLRIDPWHGRKLLDASDDRAQILLS